MKRLLLTCGTLGLLQLGATAQQEQQHGVGLHFGGYDFIGPQTSNYLTSERYRYEYNEAKEGFDTTIKSGIHWNPLVKFSYWYKASTHLDLSAALSFANLQYPEGRTDSNYINIFRYNTAGAKTEKFFSELDLRAHYNILDRSTVTIAPYLAAGITASFFDVYYGAAVPLGIGAHINLSKSRDLSLNLESNYKVAVSEHVVNHLQHTIGVVYWFKPGYKKPAVTKLADVLPPPDADNDGVVDSLDECPSIAGLPQFNGCPDSDNDGVADSKDDCPLVAGTPAMNGCPDSDGDGINDKLDQCPYVAGTAERQGCPVPDKDGDGFNDAEDRCPDKYSKTNNGCPEIRREIVELVERAAKAIFFETGKSTIRKVSFKPLDQVVATLRNNPDLYADIEGHTDNVGDDNYNMELSHQRAQAVVDYFVSKGISTDRLKATGYGETRPVATNETAAGKAQNRRTEIKLRNYR